jgi:peptidoglycan/xylan/chitin deacetylase (PgdA/CDA1 family)
MLNSFRVLLLFSAALVFWFAFFSERAGMGHHRRSPLATRLADVPNKCAIDGVFAMTFDEGPPSKPSAVLSTLSKNKIPATVHVVTKYLKVSSVESNLDAAFDQGLLIGLRFATDKNPTDMSAKELKQELLDSSEAIFKVIGKYPKFLRFGAGQANDQAIKIASELGFIVTTWNIDSYDYDSSRTAKQIIDAYVDKVKLLSNNKTSFIGLHRDTADVSIYGKDETILPTIVKNMTAAGFQPVSLDKCLGVTSPYRESNADPAGEVKAGSPATSDSTKIFASKELLIGLILFFLLI